MTPDRRLRSLANFVAARAVDVGLARGTDGFAPFVVIGWYRTGSNLLLSLLNSDPCVAAYSEVFSPRGVFWGNAAYRPPGSTARQLAARTTDAAAFLHRCVYRRHPVAVRAVGFKLFYPQITQKAPSGLIESLLAIPRLRVVHLRRRNLFRIFLSTRIAKQTGQMAATSEDAVAAAQSALAPFRIAADECAAFFEDIERRAEECAAVFSGCSTLDMAYEELTSDHIGASNRVRVFLGLPPGASTTRLVRQTSASPLLLVTNYEELCEQFSSTRWAPFFDERSR